MKGGQKQMKKFLLYLLDFLVKVIYSSIINKGDAPSFSLVAFIEIINTQGCTL